MRTKFTIIGLFTLFLLFSYSKNFAQPASSYGFQAISGTFTEITGTPFAAVQSDDVLPAATIPIGFTFNFCGTDYTTIRAGSNGIMCFLANSSNTSYNDVSSFSSIRPGLFWLWTDLDGSTGTAAYETIGTAPNRIFTMQYKFWEWNWAAAGPNISVQVKLYETTNVIEYVYRADAAPGSPSGASIGIVDHAAQNSYLSVNSSLATATASSTQFTTGISTKPATGQVFRFSPPSPCNTVANMPTAGTVAITPATICQSGKPTMTFTPATPMPIVTGVTYQWQSGPTATGPFTDIVGALTTAPTYTLTTNISANTYFRCVVRCVNTALFNSSAGLANVLVPAVPTVSNLSRCGSGAVSINASGFSGSTIRWFTAPTGGMPIFTGNPFVTPNLAATTTYYVSAGTPSVADTVSIGLGGSSGSSTYTPFNGGWGGYKYEFLITQAELEARGIFPGSLIKSVSMWQTSGTNTYNGFTMRMGTTTANALTTTFQTGTNIVFGPVNHTTNAGRLLYTFTNPYAYQGGNLVISTCWSNGNSSNTITYVSYDATSYAATHYNYGDNQTPATVCGYTSGGSTVNFRPKFTFDYDYSCQSLRAPVTVTVTPAPLVTMNYPTLVCNNEIVPIRVTSALGNYSSYNWISLNGGSFYTNAAATAAYNNTSEPVIYYRSTVAGNNKIVLSSLNSTTTCAALDTISIFVQPSGSQLLILGDPDSICNSGSSKLTLSNNIFNATNAVWQTSTNGTTYTNLTVSSLPYTTPTLTAHQYYRYLLKKDANTNCDTINKMIFVSNPSLDSVRGGGICGAGSVNLYARGVDNANIAWYESPTSTTPVFMGNNFATPYITSSTTYYAAARSISRSDTVSLGAGAQNSSSTYTPFNGGWGGYKYEFLITQAELAAIGILPGYSIKSLSLWQSSGSSTYNSFRLSLGTTTATDLTTTYQTSPTPVFGPVNYTTSAGRLLMTFSAPYVYTGGNLVVQTCWSNGNTSNPYTYVRYDPTTHVAGHYYYGDNQTPATICGYTSGGSTFRFRPKFTFEYENKCEGPRSPVVANISDKPFVDLGSDLNVCVDAGYYEFLNAQNPGLIYIWDNGYNGQVRTINQSGTYWVNVDNGLGCSTTDTVNITLKNMPVSQLGRDTNVCNGVVLPLYAGNDGIRYFWNTGETGNRINVNQAGNYIVQITGSNGCIKSDTIEVSTNGDLPTYNSVNVTNLGVRTFKFALRNPRNVSSYAWDFGDGSPMAYTASPTHTFPRSGNYIVLFRTYSSCGSKLDSIPIYIQGSTSIDDVGLENSISVYPNPAQNSLSIDVTNDALIEEVSLINVTGQVIYKQAFKNVRSAKLDLAKYNSGLYQVLIQTNKGIANKKVTIVR